MVEGITAERLHEITASPRHYGFHATLVAPFTPAPGVECRPCSVTSRRSRHRAGALSVQLKLDELDGFLALVPAEPDPEIDRLAADCVREFDRYRGELSPDDRKRREAAALSDTEREYLERWGYPYVFDRFRFHMTLTGPLEEPERGQVKSHPEAALTPHLARARAAGPAGPVHSDPPRRPVPRRRPAFRSRG